MRQRRRGVCLGTTRTSRACLPDQSRAHRAQGCWRMWAVVRQQRRREDCLGMRRKRRHRRRRRSRQEAWVGCLQMMSQRSHLRKLQRRPKLPSLRVAAVSFRLHRGPLSGHATQASQSLTTLPDPILSPSPNPPQPHADPNPTPIPAPDPTRPCPHLNRSIPCLADMLWQVYLVTTTMTTSVGCLAARNRKSRRACRRLAACLVTMTTTVCSAGHRQSPVRRQLQPRAACLVTMMLRQRSHRLPARSQQLQPVACLVTTQAMTRWRRSRLL